ncbi:ornithine cyclodeaminase family protein [Halomonas sp. MCCC 1A17488]|uniref:Ornithine cyclodeaminase family protein n=1 Tax=Billgrantia sulfidoxydans TaxID=2733484 RepID=A0ABX7W750_9GAMM|nr:MULTISPECIES: ornithine cyclodeaminase family protein [Halomonas]MCE8015435.1 ornithine cyclodeaminase family protein [Halomonas sp. MCCC 1A17488]MCG3238768.1 ornithine cyclodeaminase family protein [Halomonas sp. MCCC 1A17488]QPP51266.1 ornithine cyclodeaminase family protein [Halomonas sp. SS10-MC5]QTP54824.1 ornithine cyclodeaminase family protein [Halomonas sulfidoxydans]
MRIVTAEEVAGALPWPALVERLALTFREGVESPPRHHHAMQRPDGEATMLLMPAWERAGYIGVKMVNVFPQNADHGLPAIAGVYLLSEGAHGRPLACLDGSELTRRRTAAASALAARELAREDVETLLVVGTGKLAPMVIEAHAAVRPIKRVRVWGRNPEKARRLAAEYADRFDCAAVENLEAAARDADLISCVTLSSEPLIRGEWLAPGTHLDLIGAFRPSMRETDAECLRRGEVYVDTYAGARGEAGDILQAIDEGAFAFDDIAAELAELLRGEKAGRRSAEAITVFKSVGASLEDLAAAIEVWEQLEKRA